MSHKIIMAIYGTTDWRYIVLYSCLAFLAGAALAKLQARFFKRD